MSAKPFTAELQRLGLPLRHAAHVEPETPTPVPAIASPTVTPGATPAEFMEAIGRIERRLDELSALQPAAAAPAEVGPDVAELQRRIQATLIEFAALRHPKAEQDRLVVLASGREGDREKGALSINQDAALLGATMIAGTSVSHGIGQGRRAYLVVARGAVRVNGTDVAERDGVAVSGESAVMIEAVGDTEVLIADLP